MQAIKMYETRKLYFSVIRTQHIKKLLLLNHSQMETIKSCITYDT